MCLSLQSTPDGHFGRLRPTIDYSPTSDNISSVPQPFSPPEAKALIRKLLAEGTVWPTKHALAEMARDSMDMVDVTNVLRGGIVEPAEWENGAWRYRVRTPRGLWVVVELDEDAAELVVVTAWRAKP